jgi:Tfp pilus assembly protein PilF
LTNPCLEDATGLLTETLQIAQAVQHSMLEASVLNEFGRTYLVSGEPARAVAMFDRALAKCRDSGAFGVEPSILISVGAARTRLGEFGQARGALQHALERGGMLGQRLNEAKALHALSELALASGDPGQAAALAGQAACACRELGALPDEARALALLGHVHTALGDNAAANSASARAAALRAKFTGGVPAHGGD